MFWKGKLEGYGGFTTHHVPPIILVCKAVATDCEMGTAQSGNTPLHLDLCLLMRLDIPDVDGQEEGDWEVNDT
jgi:hypothetical protein